MTLGQRLLPSTGAAAFTPCTTAIPGGSPATVINDTEHNAFPGVARMANGNLIVVYRKGSDHSGSQDGNLISRTSADNGATWSTETTFYNHATLDARDPEVTVLADGTVIVLFFLHTEATGLGDVYVIRSTDNGAAWGTPVALGSSFTSYEFCSAKVVELTDGTLVGRAVHDPIGIGRPALPHPHGREHHLPEHEQRRRGDLERSGLGLRGERQAVAHRDTLRRPHLRRATLWRG
jgi:hypothetical protein